jgi:hypothetical protein
VLIIDLEGSLHPINAERACGTKACQKRGIHITTCCGNQVEVEEEKRKIKPKYDTLLSIAAYLCFDGKICRFVM